MPGPNCATAGPLGPLRIDLQAPTVTVTVPGAGQEFGQYSVVPPEVTCSDGAGAGLVGPAAGCVYPSTIDTSTPGQHTFVAEARDAVLNRTEVSVQYIVIPAPPPTLRSSNSGQTYLLGANVLVDFECEAAPGGLPLVFCGAVELPMADPPRYLESGVDSLDTSTVGTHRFLLGAYDSAFNVTQVEISYEVVTPPAPQLTAPTVPSPPANVAADPDGSGGLVIRVDTSSAPAPPITVQANLACPAGDASPVTGATLHTQGGDVAMTDLGGGTWEATIPASAVVDGPVTVTVTGCAVATSDAQLGTIVLYDPSGFVTDAVTDLPIPGATVTLWNIPGWTDPCPDAPTSLGVAPGAGTYDPAVNPQSTDANGHYGWDVAAGCWFATVTAAGYDDATSPVVGVPPEVTDLDVELTPTAVPDTTAPEIVCDPVPAGWQADNVTLSCTASDSESGLAEAGDASFGLSTTVPADAEDPAAMTGSNEVCGNAGNCATAGPLGPVMVDLKAPTITVTLPAEGQDFTQGALVDPVVSCTDGGSGVQVCSYPPQLDTTTTGLHLFVVTTRDNSGNFAEARVNYNVLPPPDTTPPTITCDPVPAGWQGINVQVPCTASDSESGLAEAGDASFDLSTTVPAGSEDPAAMTGFNEVCDTVGNCAMAGPLGPVMVDLKAPDVSCDAAPSAWNADNVTLSCTGIDGGSGPGSQSVSLSTTVAAGTETAAATTDSADVCDAVNNCATAGPISPIKVDRKAPTITVTTPTPGQHVAQGATVNSVVSCTDAGSGVPVGGCSFPATLDTATAGTKNLHVAAVDLAGNPASADVSYVVDPVAATGDWVSVAFSGNTTYSNAATATASNLSIAKHANGKVKSIYGTLTIPSKVSGNATVIFQLSCGIPGICSGKVTVSDIAANFYRQTPAVFAAVNVVTGANPAPGAPSPFLKAARARLPWFGWALNFTVDDRA